MALWSNRAMAAGKAFFVFQLIERGACLDEIMDALETQAVVID
jgi:hypothetical protein